MWTIVAKFTSSWLAFTEPMERSTTLKISTKSFARSTLKVLRSGQATSSFYSTWEVKMAISPTLRQSCRDLYKHCLKQATSMSSLNLACLNIRMETPNTVALCSKESWRTTPRGWTSGLSTWIWRSSMAVAKPTRPRQDTCSRDVSHSLKSWLSPRKWSLCSANTWSSKIHLEIKTSWLT